MLFENKKIAKFLTFCSTHISPYVFEYGYVFGKTILYNKLGNVKRLYSLTFDVNIRFNSDSNKTRVYVFSYSEFKNMDKDSERMDMETKNIKNVRISV